MLAKSRNGRTARSRALAAAGVATLAMTAGLTAGLTAAASAGGAAVGPVPHAVPAMALQWSQTVGDGAPIAASSPNLITVNGVPSVVVGDRAGNLLSYALANGAAVNGSGVLYHAPGPIDSTPSSFPGWNGVLFGVGNAATPYGGGYFAVNGNGSLDWMQSVHNLGNDPSPFSAVVGGMAVGSAPGLGPFAVAGSLGEFTYALEPSGTVAPGFPTIQPDGDFSTPAVFTPSGATPARATPHDGSAAPLIVTNDDSTAGVYDNVQYQNGNIVRVMNPAGQVQCQYQTDQAGESSPAVGRFFGDSATVGIAFGTGDYFTGASDTDKVFAIDSECHLHWAATLDGVTASSPALADTQGNGQLQVVEGTNVGDNNSSGSVWDLNGANGVPLWHVPADGAVIGSITTVDPDHQGYQDLLVPTTGGVEMLDGRSGAKVIPDLGAGQAFQNSPLVTTDPNGTIGITIAGYGSGGGVVDHYEVSGSTGNLAHDAPQPDVLSQAGGWPMFHHDAQLTGSQPLPPVNVEVRCAAPAGPPTGYYEAASDGGIFNFGNLPFCGSTGALTLNKPVVGIAATNDGGGYWMVATDGGMFAFGDARFYGSMGGRSLNRPIVGMAATPDGGGYNLVASDGGIFSFGDAKFYGSTGAIRLNQPIVGMALTADGRGYWLVAADGGMFSFGDARFFGSMGGQRLDSPVVGMAADTQTGGYWLVAADGGIFAFRARYDGSMGGQRLNEPIVGMESLVDGDGYRFVASDGGIFNFGAAAFYGSMGGKPLNDPIVSLSGF